MRPGSGTVDGRDGARIRTILEVRAVLTEVRTWLFLVSISVPEGCARC